MADSVEADYCFRIGGTRKFFIEAKKPSVNLKDDIHPAFWLRRYAWSTKLPYILWIPFKQKQIGRLIYQWFNLTESVPQLYLKGKNLY